MCILLSKNILQYDIFMRGTFFWILQDTPIDTLFLSQTDSNKGEIKESISKYLDEKEISTKVLFFFGFIQFAEPIIHH